MDNTNRIHNFISNNNNILLDIFNKNYKDEDETTHGIIYIQLKQIDNIELAYMTYNQLKSTELLTDSELELINNMNKKYIIYCNNMIDNHTSLLIIK